MIKSRSASMSLCAIIIITVLFWCVFLFIFMSPVCILTMTGIFCAVFVYPIDISGLYHISVRLYFIDTKHIFFHKLFYKIMISPTTSMPYFGKKDRTFFEIYFPTISRVVICYVDRIDTDVVIFLYFFFRNYFRIFPIFEACMRIGYSWSKIDSTPSNPDRIRWYHVEGFWYIIFLIKIRMIPQIIMVCFWFYQNLFTSAYHQQREITPPGDQIFFSWLNVPKHEMYFVSHFFSEILSTLVRPHIFF